MTPTHFIKTGLIAVSLFVSTTGLASYCNQLGVFCSGQTVSNTEGRLGIVLSVTQDNQYLEVLWSKFDARGEAYQDVEHVVINLNTDNSPFSEKGCLSDVFCATTPVYFPSKDGDSAQQGEVAYVNSSTNQVQVLQDSIVFSAEKSSHNHSPEDLFLAVDTETNKTQYLHPVLQGRIQILAENLDKTSVVINISWMDGYGYETFKVVKKDELIPTKPE